MASFIKLFTLLFLISNVIAIASSRRLNPQQGSTDRATGAPVTVVDAKELTSIQAKPEIERKGQGSAKWVAKRSPQTPISKETPAHSGTNRTATARGDALLDGRVNQQRRQMLVRQEVQTSVSHNGLNHCVQARDARREGKLPDIGRPSKSGEPTEEGKTAHPGKFRFSGHIPDANGSPRASEPTRVGESSKAGEPRHNHLADKRKEDLREYLTPKRTISEANPQCQCERLIHTVLADCQCVGTAKPSVFERLSQQSSRPRLSRRRRRHQKGSVADDLELASVTVNMTDKEKAALSNSPDSDSVLRPNTRFARRRQDGIFQQTRSRRGASIGFDYSTLVPPSYDEDEVHSAAATSQTSRSSQDAQARVHMTKLNTEQTMAQKMEEQTATIDSLREMMEQLLNKKKKKKRT
ncbi:uncharacterized protein A4U43_C01F19590 [Asparagus officinalis]|uniref:Uncharacterized protein n=1 Tax=Asparagus officinalis TaxID=4686 RepID=A0A5P1FQM8_ASPOF|nr:uncharacterized protein A4U43_C01F19590 [Asparagus officinalis]